LGWIVFSARSEKGDWDLYRMRPDGSQRAPLTQTPKWNEGLPVISRDGSRMLYRRIDRADSFDGNKHGQQGRLVLALSDGRDPKVLGEDGDLPWASWGPDGKTIATLSPAGVSFLELETLRVVRTLPRKGFFQQLTWSADGEWLSGVSNGFKGGWSVARMNARTGEVNPVRAGDCCTPDWFPDGKRVIFSNRRESQKIFKGYGWTELWQADPDGQNQRLIYAEENRHIYGGHVSPDGRYALFTGNPQEDGDSENSGSPMALIRLSDAKRGPVLPMSAGWEPCWTSSEKPGGPTP
jgi:Tol biopolymer transport system component